MNLRPCSTQAGEGGRLCAWVAALPERVPLPAVTFSDEDLAACGDADTVREARAIRASLDASFAVRGPPGCSQYVHLYARWHTSKIIRQSRRCARTLSTFPSLHDCALHLYVPTRWGLGLKLGPAWCDTWQNTTHCLKLCLIKPDTAAALFTLEQVAAWKLERLSFGWAAAMVQMLLCRLPS